jgi:hypothetical protein
MPRPLVQPLRAFLRPQEPTLPAQPPRASLAQAPTLPAQPPLPASLAQPLPAFPAQRAPTFPARPRALVVQPLRAFPALHSPTFPAERAPTFPARAPTFPVRLKLRPPAWSPLALTFPAKAQEPAFLAPGRVSCRWAPSARLAARSRRPDNRWASPCPRASLHLGSRLGRHSGPGRNSGQDANP